MLAWMEFSKHILADLDTRPRRRSRGLQLNDVRHVGKDFGRELRRDRVQEGLPRVIRMHRIGEDVLAGMEGVRAFRRKRLGRVAVVRGLGSGGVDFESGKIFDRAGPSELGIVEGGVVTNDGGKQRERRDKKHDVPQGSGEEGALGNASLDPAIAEIIAGEKFSGCERAGEKRAEAACNALVEIAPGHFELGLDNDGRRRRNRKGGHPRCGGLSQKVETTIDLAQRHEGS